MQNGLGAAAQDNAGAAGDAAVAQGNAFVRFMNNPTQNYLSNVLFLVAGVGGVYVGIVDMVADPATAYMPDVLDVGMAGTGIWSIVHNVYAIGGALVEIYSGVDAGAMGAIGAANGAPV